MSQFLQFVMILALVVLGCTKVTLQGRVSRKHIRNTADSVLFNAQLFFAMAAVMALIFPIGGIGWSGIVLALLGALGTFLFQTCYALGLKSGPVSLTVLLVNFSVLFITAFSIFFFHERLYLSQLIGIIFLLVSMVLSVKKDDRDCGVSGKWIALTFAAMLATSAASVFMKIFVKNHSAEIENSENTFVVLMYAFASVMAFAYYLFAAHVGKKEKNTYGFWNRSVLLFVLLISIALGLYQKFYVIGLGNIDGAFMFPTYAGLQSLGMTVIGILFFRDRLSLRQKIGIVCGIACVVLMNLNFVVLF